MKRGILLLFLLLFPARGLLAEGFGGVDLLGTAGRPVPISTTGSIYKWAVDPDGAIHQCAGNNGAIVYRSSDLKGSYPTTREWPVYQGTFTATPLMEPDGVGGAYVSWADSLTAGNVFLHRLNGSYGPSWRGFIQVAQTPGAIPDALASDGVGGCLVVWDINATEIRVQRVASSGQALWQDNGVIVMTSSMAGGQRLYVLKALSDGVGGALVLITAGPKPGDLVTASTKYAIRIQADGKVAWVTRFSGPIVSPSADMLSDGQGGCLLAWSEFPVPKTASHIIRGQRIRGDGSLAWGGSGIVIQQASDSWARYPIRLASDGGGGFLVAWAESVVQEYYVSLNVQHVDQLGLLDWIAPSSVNGYASIASAYSLEPDGLGGVVAILQRPSGSYPTRLLRIGSDAASIWGDTGVTLNSTVYAAKSDGQGGVWLVGSSASTSSVVRARHLADFWTFKAGGRIYSAPTVVDGIAYFGCDNGRIYAVATQGMYPQITATTNSGSLLGVYPPLDTQGTPAPPPIRSQLVYYGNTLYFTDADGYVCACNTNMGRPSPRWRVRPDGQSVRTSGATSTPAVGSDGSVYVTINVLGGAKLYKLDAAGMVKGSLPAGRYAAASPALFNDKLVYSSPQDPTGSIKVARSSDLTILSSFGDPTTENVGSPVVDPIVNRVYGADLLGGLWAVDLMKSQPVLGWPADYSRLPAPTEASPWLQIVKNSNGTYTRTLYFATVYGHLCALDADTGMSLNGYPLKPREWLSFHACPVVIYQPSIQTNIPLFNRLYLGSGEGAMYSFDLNRPGYFASLRVPGSFMTSPGAYLNYNSQNADNSDRGGLVFASTDGTVYGLPIR